MMIKAKFEGRNLLLISVLSVILGLQILVWVSYAFSFFPINMDLAENYFGEHKTMFRPEREMLLYRMLALSIIFMQLIGTVLLRKKLGEPRLYRKLSRIVTIESGILVVLLFALYLWQTSSGIPLRYFFDVFFLLILLMHARYRKNKYLVFPRYGSVIYNSGREILWLGFLFIAPIICAAIIFWMLLGNHLFSPTFWQNIIGYIVILLIYLLSLVMVGSLWFFNKKERENIFIIALYIDGLNLYHYFVNRTIKSSYYGVTIPTGRKSVYNEQLGNQNTHGSGKIHFFNISILFFGNPCRV